MSDVTTLAGRTLDSIKSTGGATVQLGQYPALLKLDEFQPETYAVGIQFVGEIDKPVEDVTEDDVDYMFGHGWARSTTQPGRAYDHAVGFWVDPDSGYTVVDLVTTTTVLGIATEMAIKHEQKAIYALKAGVAYIMP